MARVDMSITVGDHWNPPCITRILFLPLVPSTGTEAPLSHTAFPILSCTLRLTRRQRNSDRTFKLFNYVFRPNYRKRHSRELVLFKKKKKKKKKSYHSNRKELQLNNSETRPASLHDLCQFSPKGGRFPLK